MEQEKIRLFLSYGHEEKNSVIVNEIVKYLSGHFYIWIDKRDIPDHFDWRLAIEKGINETDLTLGLLSAYSTRERSVCLDELGISVSIPGRKLITAILDKEKDICVPSTVSHNQWLDLSEWKQHYGTEGWDDYFIPRMDTIVHSIKNEENFEFQGQITKLCKVLKPVLDNKKYLSYIDSGNLCGREWLHNSIEQWADWNDSTRFMFLTGGPGTGKSHFSAHYQHYNPKCAAAFFCDYSRKNPNYVKNIIRTLSFILATKYPDYRYKLIIKLTQLGLFSDDGAILPIRIAEYFDESSEYILFDDLLCLDGVGGHNQNCVILIDGIDEVGDGESNPLMDILCSNLLEKMPPHYKFLFTTRKVPSIITKAKGLRHREVDLDCEKSAGDLKEYIGMRLSAMNVSESNIDKLTEKCEYMFLQAKLMCDAIISGEISFESALSMPGGISGLFYRYFDRIFGSNSNYDFAKEFLRVIVAYDIGEIPEELLKNALSVSSEEIGRFYSVMQSFALRTSSGRNFCVSLFHKSLYDWLTDMERSGKYFVDKETGKNKILEYCKNVMESGGKDLSFDLQKSVYQFVSKNGGNLKRRIPASFLYNLQFSSFEKSDIELFSKLEGEIRVASIINGNDEFYIKSQCLKVDWLYDTVNDRKGAFEQLNSLISRYPDIRNRNADTYCRIELNRAYLGNIYEKRSEEAYERIKALISFIEGLSISELPERSVLLAKTAYHKGIIEFGLGKYDDCIDSCENAIMFSEMAYPDPERLICLIENLQGNCFIKFSRFDEAISVLRHSLELKTKLHGEYSSYAATAYQNLVRAFYEKALKNGEPLDPVIFDYLEKLKRISIFLFGENSRRMAVYYENMAKVCEYNGNTEEAALFARKNLELYEEQLSADVKQEMQEIIGRCG